MNRRRFLASSASGVGVATAGCLAGTGPPETVEPGDTISIKQAAFELGELHLQWTFVEQRWPHWNAVDAEDAMFAVVPLRPTTGTDRQDAREALRAATVTGRFDGEDRGTDPDDTVLNEDDQDGIRVGVPMPTETDADSAALVFEDGRSERYPLGDDHVATLERPPAIALDFAVPETTGGMRIPVTATVTNDGERPGTIAWTTTHSIVADAWWTYRTTVPPGDSKTLEHVHDRLNADDEVRLIVDYGFDELTRTVTVTDD